jgi:DNA-binding HxlR family transcriptional regulator
MVEQTYRNGKVVCPYESTISLIGNKWSLMILRNLRLQDDPWRFNQMQNSLKGISSKTLSAKLKELVGNGIVQKEIANITPILIHYKLTEKGEDLTPILDAMASWSNKWEHD